MAAQPVICACGDRGRRDRSMVPEWREPDRGSAEAASLPSPTPAGVPWHAGMASRDKESSPGLAVGPASGQSLRWTFLLAVLVVIFYLYFLVVLEPAPGQRVLSIPLPSPRLEEPQRRNSTVPPQVLDAQRFAERRELVEEQCFRNGRLYEGNATWTKLRSRLLVDPRHRFAFCYIPKVGCSFWKRVLVILAGMAKSRLVYDASGIQVHGQATRLSPNWASLSTAQAALANYSVMTISRDPFERLFSGYVDKFLALPNPSFHALVRPYTKTRCAEKVRFKDVVRYLLWSEQTGQSRNPHFFSQWEQCFPCTLKYRYLAKMDTFMHDAVAVLKELNLTSDVDLRQDDPSVNDLSIIRDVITRSCSNRELKCFDRNTILRRLWKVFQVRGFIHIREDFPLSSGAANAASCDDAQKMFEKAYRGQTGTRKERMRQRKEALLEAYHSLDKAELDQLRQVFRKDCDIYGYDCDRSELSDPGPTHRTRKYFSGF